MFLMALMVSQGGCNITPRTLSSLISCSKAFELFHITNVSCRAKTKLPDPDVGTLQEKSAADGAKPGEHVSKVALHTTSRKRCNGVRRPQMKSPRCLSQISQYAICSDVSSRTDMPNLPAFS